MNLLGDNFNFNKVKTALVSKLMPNIGKQLATDALLFFRTNYNRQGWQPDTTFIPWAQRKYRLNTSKLLVDTGAMRDSLKIVSTRFGNIRLVDTDKKAEFHNEGTDHLPARPFMYPSKALDTRQKAIITREMEKLFKF